MSRRGAAAVLAALRADAERGPRTVRLADVKPEKITWLWKPRIPLGMITLLDGDPGLGKSTTTIDIAARVSTGAPMPLDTMPTTPADVVLLTAEDHLAATIRPRLDAAGADVNRIHALIAVPRDGDPDAPPILPADVDALETVIRTHRASLVVIDPLMAFLGGEIDSYRDQDVRRALRPLAAVAERTGAAVLIVRHLRKSTGPALYRGGGSIGVIGAARSALIAAVDPEDDQARLLASSKSNLAPLAPALRWRLVDAGGAARVEWMGIAEGITADDLAAPPELAAGASEVERVAEVVREMLTDGPVPAATAARDIRAQAGCSDATLRRARDHLGVVCVRDTDARGRARAWTWSLPPDPGPVAHVHRNEHLVTSERDNAAESESKEPTSPDAHRPDAQVAMNTWSGDPVEGDL